MCVSGRRLKVLWGKAQTTPSLGVKGQQTLAPVPGLPAGECPHYSGFDIGALPITAMFLFVIQLLIVVLLDIIPLALETFAQPLYSE